MTQSKKLKTSHPEYYLPDFIEMINQLANIAESFRGVVPKMFEHRK